MYEEHFGFSGPPFRLNPDPKFFFGSRSHNKAMAYLHYGLRQGEGFIVISGEIGAGKSMLIGHLLDQLDRSNVVAANLLTTNLEPNALLSHMLSAFRIEAAGAGRTAEIEAFEDFLFDQINRGRRVLLIVDEAQNLPVRTIEELRMLSNMDYEGTPLFQVFLVGQPEFRAILAKPDMEQFRQRVIASYHLEPLGPEETREYIEHRLSMVGWQHNPHFVDEAFATIYEATGGVPRKVNKLCNRILLHCSLEKLTTVDRAAVMAVVSDLKEESFERAGAPDDEAVETKPLRDVVAAAAPDAAEEEQPQAQAASGGAPVVIPFGAPRKLNASANPPEPPAEPRREQQAEIPPTPVEVALERSKSAKPKAKKLKAEAPTPEPTPISAVQIAVAASGAEAPASALDRLRALRETTKPQDDRRPATLADVRTAIEAVRSEAVVEPHSDDPAADDSGLIPAEDIKSWRESIVKSIEETRRELKTAHESIARLRRQLAELDTRRRDKRDQISAGLTKAEAILSEFRNAPR